MIKIAFGCLFFLPLIITACGAGKVREADSSFSQGNYGQAAALYEEYLAQHPGAPLTRRKYGLALLQDNRPEQAVEQFKQALDGGLHDSRSLLYLGLAYLHLGEYRQTLAVWQQYEIRGKPGVAAKVARQSERLAEALPTVSDQLVGKIDAAVRQAIWTQQLRDAYNASRLEECGGGG